MLSDFWLLNWCVTVDQGWSTCSSWAKCHLWHNYFLHGDIGNEKIFVNPLPSKVEIDHQNSLEKLCTIYSWRLYFTLLMNLEICVRHSDTLAKFVNYIFLQLLLLVLVYIFIAHEKGKYTDKIIHIIMCIFIHSLFCILNFMLHACGQNFVEVACTTNRV
jgi:hypothetical protein